MTHAPLDSEFLSRLADASEGNAILWRGAPSPGSDVDLVVLASALPALGRALRSSGMRPWVGDPGHVVWRDHADRVPEIDVLPAHRWPLGYPSLEGLVARSSDGDGALPVAAPEDRLLIFAADALAGRPVAGLASRARGLLEDSSVPARLEAVAAEEGLTALAALISEPDRLVARARRGRLTYGTAARAAVQSPAARAALRSRLASRLGLRPRGLLVALSGMDGAGKSTLAGEVVAALEEGGVPATTAWARFGQEAATLDALAGPVKRLIPRRGTVADPIAAGGPGVDRSQDPGEMAGRRRLVSWIWILLVAAVNARSLRRSARPRRGGVAVVCDRWVTDSLVDLRLRYGSHRGAVLALRAAVPRPDLGLLLSLDAETAARRKPGDQDPAVLRRAVGLYEEEARRGALARVDARASSSEVAAEVVEQVRRLL